MYGVWRIELAIEMTAAGELYHGQWSRPAAGDDQRRWSIVHTLHAGDVVAGAITLSGTAAAGGVPYLDKVEKLVRVVEDRLVSQDSSVSASETTSLSAVRLSVNSVMT